MPRSSRQDCRCLSSSRPTAPRLIGVALAGMFLEVESRLHALLTTSSWVLLAAISAIAHFTSGGGCRDFAALAVPDECARASSVAASSTTSAALAGTRPA